MRNKASKLITRDTYHNAKDGPIPNKEAVVELVTCPLVLSYCCFVWVFVFRNNTCSKGLVNKECVPSFRLLSHQLEQLVNRLERSILHLPALCKLEQWQNFLLSTVPYQPNQWHFSENYGQIDKRRYRCGSQNECEGFIPVSSLVDSDHIGQGVVNVRFIHVYYCLK